MMRALLVTMITILVVIGLPVAVMGQDYVGSDQCALCHNSVNPNVNYNIWEEYSKTGHPYKLNEVNGAPPVYPPNTSPGVPFPPPAAPDWNDYVYVIGGYGWKARFVQAADGKIFTADDSAQYNLFPRGTPQWVAYHLGEDKPYNYNCFQCHTTGPDPNGSWHPTTPNLGTFSEPGIRCEGCHGPGSLHVASPTTTPPPITGDSLAYTRCGDCHHRGSKTNVIPASNGYIRHHEQFNEMKASKHGDGNAPDLTCASCHDTHIPLLYPDAASPGLSGIKQDCETCHQGYEVLLNGQPKNIECIDCHMPYASKSAVGTQEGNGWMGDVRTHIWLINTDPVTRDSMFTPDGGQVKLDAEGHAKVTLDFVCLPCHQDKSVNWAAAWAPNTHNGGFVGIPGVAEVPTEFQLFQNYPNPFNPSTKIEFALPKTSKVRLAVYDLLGQEVAVLVDGTMTPGLHTVDFSPENLSSGVYIYRLESDDVSLTKKMVLIR
ncbi:MAG: T9SS C-terminal target domain-containing protein [Calditrichaeota bacterium]|nr:MAG: T9SS C-terminal target domain-containing protein [Calditrichota bacterium]